MGKVGSHGLVERELSMVETSYHKCRAYTKLLFLYILTGQREKLTKLARILKVKGDFSGLYQIHLLTGNKVEAAQLLEDSGNKELAHLMKSRNSNSLKLPEAVCEAG